MPSKTERMGEEKEEKQEEKAKGKSQFCFLHNVFARSSLTNIWNRRQHSVRLILNDEF